MTVTFVPAPGWPAIPSGWLPDAGWVPDPSWPAAPAGWIFYKGPYGEPVLPPTGRWVPSATITGGSVMPGSAAVLPPQSGFSPPVPASAASPQGVRSRNVLLGVAGALVVVMMAAAAWVFVPKLLAGEPTLTDAQARVLVGDPAIDALALEEHDGSETGFPPAESCQKYLSVERSHMRSYFVVPTFGASGSRTGSTSYIGVFDGPSAAAEGLALIGPCNKEVGGGVVTPVTQESKGAWTTVEGQGRSAPFVAVRYGNIVAIAASGRVSDPGAYLEVLVAAVDRARSA